MSRPRKVCYDSSSTDPEICSGCNRVIPNGSFVRAGLCEECSEAQAEDYEEHRREMLRDDDHYRDYDCYDYDEDGASY